MARKITLEFTEKAIYTARAGLVPVNEVARKLKLQKAIDQACYGMRAEHKTTYNASTFVMYKVLGHLSGFHRVDQILKSSEAGLLATLCELDDRAPVATTFSRFFNATENEHVVNFQNLNFELATKKLPKTDGFQIITHDQTAIQKYGNKMEGVEKGYGGTLKRGSKMLQASMVFHAGMSSILHLEIRPGSTHSVFDASGEIDYVLEEMKKINTDPKLVLADSAYGVGNYMKACDEHKSSFVLAVKNDSWMKSELNTLDFQRFHRGTISTEYGYREFEADRKAWQGSAQQSLDPDFDWNGLRRVIVVNLPCEDGKKYQFLATNLPKEQYSAEEVHRLYRENRESIELANDELKNQLGLTELPSQQYDANRLNAQIIALAWNLQRHIEHVSMAEERKAEEIRLAKLQYGSLITKKARQRFEWWTLFVRFISVGGRLRFGGNKTSVISTYNEHLSKWVDAITKFDWKQYKLA